MDYGLLTRPVSTLRSPPTLNGQSVGLDEWLESDLKPTFGTGLWHRHRELPGLAFDLVAKSVDDGGIGVALVLNGDVRVDGKLCRPGCFLFLRLGNRRDEIGTAAGIEDPLCRLSRAIEFPVSGGGRQVNSG